MDSYPGVGVAELRNDITKGPNGLESMDHLLGGLPMSVEVTIVRNGRSLTTQALADTGASTNVMISEAIAEKLMKYLDVMPEERVPKSLAGFDGKISQEVNLVIKTNLRVQGRVVPDVEMVVTNMGHDMILGRIFMENHDLLVDCRRGRLLFPPEWVPSLPSVGDIPMDQAGNLLTDPSYDEDVERRNRLFEKEDKRRRDGRMSQARKTTNQRMGAPLPEQVPNEALVQQRIKELEQVHPKEVPVHTATPKILLRSPRRFHELERGYRQGESRMNQRLEEDQRSCEGETDSTPPHHPTKEEPRTDKYQSRDAQGPYALQRDGVGWYKHRPPDVACIGAVGFSRALKEPGTQEPVAIDLFTLDKWIEDQRADELLPGDEEELRRKAQELVPRQHHEHLDVFSKAVSDRLSEHRPGVDHNIELEDKPETLGYSPLYKMSLEEMETCRKYISEHLEKGFIEPSSAPWAAPVLFSRKASGGLRLCVDYRKLNAITRKDRYPLPLIEETLTRLAQARIFTKIDIRQAFHKVRLVPGVEDLTTFRTRYGAYKYRVVPFGLTNGPSTFQRFINHTFRGYLDEFCTAYIDDILIYSKSREEHEEHVSKVLDRLREAGLQADLAKCEFYVTETKFLGYIIKPEGVGVDPDKVEVIRDWGIPIRDGKAVVKGVRSFLGFCNFYRKFIEKYGQIAKPLSELTHIHADLTWTSRHRQAFDELKQKLAEAPVLRHFDYNLETMMETDVSDGVAAGALSQRISPEDPWHPVAFYSENLHGAELNYGIHDKEMLAMMKGLLCWRSELIGLQNERPFVAITDHRALEYFSTKRVLNLRQAGWAELMSQYNFIITYRPGERNTIPDILSRPMEGTRTQKEKRDEQRTMALFRPTTAPFDTGDDPVPIFVLGEVDPPEKSGVELLDELLQANKTDPELADYRVKGRSTEELDWEMRGELVLYQGRLVVPEQNFLRTRVIEEAHARLGSAHPGKGKTRKLVSSRYWWPKMHTYIDQYVDNCPCRSAKVPRDKTPGLLSPLPIPDERWEHLVMDFKEMPKDKDGYDNIFVVIDRLTKMTWTTPCHKTATGKDAAWMYYNGPYRWTGWPASIVSDQGRQFTGHFTDEASRIHGTKLEFATAGHKQSSGQVEIMNEYIDQRLRPFVNHFQDNWSRALPAMDGVQASMPHESLGGVSPRQVLMGKPMRTTYDWEARTRSLEQLPVPERMSRKEAQDMARQIKEWEDFAKRAVQRAQEQWTRSVNQHRREPDFGLGDRVFIRSKAGMQTDRPSDKLSFPMTPISYKIIEEHPTRPNTYKLEFSHSWRGQEWFNADRLRKDPDNPVPGQDPTNPDGEIVDPDFGEKEWEVEKVESSRLYYRKLQYQVKWKDCDPDPEWYPASDFKNSARLLKEYHDQNPEAAGPPLRLDTWLKAAEEDSFDPPHEDDDKPRGASISRTRRRQR